MGIMVCVNEGFYSALFNVINSTSFQYSKMQEGI